MRLVIGGNHEAGIREINYKTASSDALSVNGVYREKSKRQLLILILMTVGALLFLLSTSSTKANKKLRVTQ